MCVQCLMYIHFHHILMRFDQVVMVHFQIVHVGRVLVLINSRCPPKDEPSVV